MLRRLIILNCVVALLMSACTALQDRTHNAAGGYIPACDELPGLLGDDC